MELGKNGYAAQIAAYLKNEAYAKAYELATEFVQKFPDDMIAHFLLAEAAFWSGKYDEAALEGSKAFNKCSTDDDLLTCSIITGSSYFELKKYEEGYHLLRLMAKRKTNEELEKLLFVFSLELNNPQEAIKHVDELFKINKKAAEDLIVKYLQG